MHIAQGGAPSDFIGFLSLSRSTAESVDRRRPTRTPGTPSGCQRANVTEISGTSDTPVESADSLQINAIGRVSGSTMNKDVWNSLSNSAKTNWDQLDAKDKAKILAGRTLAVNHTNILGDSGDQDKPSSNDDDSPDTGESPLHVNSMEVKTNDSPDSTATQVNAAKSNAHPPRPRRCS